MSPSSSPIPGTPVSTLAFHAVSHTGHVRTENQDRWAHIALPQGDDLFLVADGMGGTQGGSVAAELTVQTFQSTLRANTALAPPTRLREAVQRANEAVYTQGQQNQDQNGMGSTAVAIWFDAQRKVASGINIGDSRAYLFRNMELMRLTKDDSLAEKMVEANKLTPAQAREHINPSLLVHALGSHSDLPPSIRPMEPFALHPGDIFLLCSDGLTSVAEDEEIAQVLAYHQSGALNQTCQNLVNMALQRGGPDNVTVLLAQIPGGDFIPVQTPAPRSGEVPAMGMVMGTHSQAVLAYQTMTHPTQLPLTQEQLALIEEDNRREHNKQRIVLYITIALIIGLLGFLASNVKLVRIKPSSKRKPSATRDATPARTQPKGKATKKRAIAPTKRRTTKANPSAKPGNTVPKKRPAKAGNGLLNLPFAPALRKPTPTRKR